MYTRLASLRCCFLEPRSSQGHGWQGSYIIWKDQRSSDMARGREPESWNLFRGPEDKRGFLGVSAKPTFDSRCEAHLEREELHTFPGTCTIICLASFTGSKICRSNTLDSEVELGKRLSRSLVRTEVWRGF